MIEGPISGFENLDLDQQIVDSDWLRRAVGPWAKFGNIREQHNPQRPVGKATSVDANHPSGVPHIIAKIVDNDAWAKVEAGIYSGFSVGIKNARIVKDAAAPKGRIIDGNLIEVSIVDHPSNTNAKFAICKSVGGGGWQDLQSGAIIEPLISETEKSAPMSIQHAVHPHGTFSHVHTFEAADHAHCPTCGDDVSACACSTEQKAAGTFTEFALSGTPIHPDHNVPASTHAPAAEGDFSGDANGINQQNAILKQLIATVNRMEEALKGGSHFNPNQEPRTSGGRSDFRTMTPPTPKADQVWHGEHPQTATPQLPKGADGGWDEEMVYKTALEACSNFFSTLLDSDGTLTKGASLEPDSTKAVFVDVIKAAVASVVGDFSERLAKVEELSMPAKAHGYVASETNKNFSLNAPLNAVTEPIAHRKVEEFVANMSDDQKLKMATHYLGEVYAAGPGA
jgi:hypothetical protein